MNSDSSAMAALQLEDVPDDVILCIFRLLDLGILIRMASTALRYKTIASEESLWRRYCEEFFGTALASGLPPKSSSCSVVLAAPTSPVAYHLSQQVRFAELVKDLCFRVVVSDESTAGSLHGTRRPRDSNSKLPVPCLGCEDLFQECSSQLPSELDGDTLGDLASVWKPLDRQPGTYRSPSHIPGSRIYRPQRMLQYPQSAALSFRFPDSMKENGPYSITVEATSKSSGVLHHFITNQGYTASITDVQIFALAHRSGLYIWDADDDPGGDLPVESHLSEGIQMMVYIHYEQMLDYLQTCSSLAAATQTMSPAKSSKLPPMTPAQPHTSTEACTLIPQATLEHNARAEWKAVIMELLHLSDTVRGIYSTPRESTADVDGTQHKDNLFLQDRRPAGFSTYDAGEGWSGRKVRVTDAHGTEDPDKDTIYRQGKSGLHNLGQSGIDRNVCIKSCTGSGPGRSKIQGHAYGSAAPMFLVLNFYSLNGSKNSCCISAPLALCATPALFDSPLKADTPVIWTSISAGAQNHHIQTHELTLADVDSGAPVSDGCRNISPGGRVQHVGSNFVRWWESKGRAICSEDILADFVLLSSNGKALLGRSGVETWTSDRGDGVITKVVLTYTGDDVNVTQTGVDKLVLDPSNTAAPITLHFTVSTCTSLFSRDMQ